MPLYLDIHNVPGASADDLRKAHVADMATQQKYGVDYRRYWFNEKCGKAFCLVEAPNVEAAEAVHREAHGLVAEKIIEIDPEMADSFLGSGDINDAGAALTPGSRSGEYDSAVRTILFTDIVGSTELAHRLGDEVAFNLMTIHDRIVVDAVVQCGGKIIKSTGDGTMAVFVSPVAAVRAACLIQTVVSQQLNEDGEAIMAIRIGAAAGEPIERNNDFFGSTVNLAARLCAHAQPGAVLVTNGIAELCLGKGMQFAKIKRANLKGLTRKFARAK